MTIIAKLTLGALLLLSILRVQASEGESAGIFGLSLHQLLEIKVTARKHEEELSQVPVSVSVIDAKTLDDINARNLLDLGRDIPVFFIDQGNNFGVRGIFSGTPNIGLEAGNSLFIDGIYSLNPLSSLVLMDIQRIELLKGPQATFYGRNTIAGAINVVPRAPELHTNSVESQLVVADRGQREVLATINLAVSEQMAARISAGHLEKDGFVHNNFDNSELHDRNIDTLRWQWLFDNESWQVKWSNDYTEAQRQTFDGQLRAPSSPASAARLAQLRAALDLSEAQTPTSSLRVNINAPKTELDEHWGSHLSISTQLGSNTRLSSISSRRSLYHHTDQDDEDHLPIFLLSAATEERWLMNNQELRLNHDVSDALSISAGFYWEQLRSSSFDNIHSSAQVLPLLGIDQNEAARIHYSSHISSSTRAMYASVDYTISEKLAVTAGARKNRDEKHLDFVQQGGCFVTSGDLQNFCFFPQIALQDQLSDQAFMPNFSVSFFPNRRSLLFMRFAEGVKSAGFNADLVQSGAPTSAGFANAFFPEVTSDVDLSLQQEMITSYEIGYRGLIDHDRYFIQSALYHLDYDDFQSSRFTGTEFVAAKNGAAEVNGWEFSAGMKNADKSEISFGLHAISSKYVNFPEGQDAQGNPINHKDNSLINAPSLAGFVRLKNFGRLNQQLNWQSNLNLNYRSDYYTAPANGSASRVDATYRINARLGLLPVHGNWSLFLWARNLTDQVDETQNQTNSLTGLEQTTLSEPRSLGIQFKLAID